MLPARAARCAPRLGAGIALEQRGQRHLSTPGVDIPHWTPPASRIASCSGLSAPSGPARPSTVRTRRAVGQRDREQAAGADRPAVDQHRAGPAAPCSHPSLVPVSPRSSRSASANVPARSPSTRSRRAVDAEAHLHGSSLLRGLGPGSLVQRPGDQDPGQLPPVAGGGVDVADGLDLALPPPRRPRRSAPCSAGRRPGRLRRWPGGRGGPRRHRGPAADGRPLRWSPRPSGRSHRAAGRTRRTPPPEAGNSAASMSSSSSRLVCSAPVNRSAAGTSRRPPGPATSATAPAAAATTGQLGGRVGVRQAAAEGAAGADGRVADPAGGLGQQRVLALRGERAVPGQGADPQPAAGPRC